MADDRYDQLLQIQQNRQYAAHQRLVQGLESQRQANWQDYCQAISENDMNAAASAESEYLRHARELAEITGGQAPQQQAQQSQPQYQQPQGQPQLSEVEMAILREFPGIASDPKKLAEAKAAADALITKNFGDPNYRNSPGYDSALRIAIGLTAADGTSTGREIASADAAIEATRGSKYCKDFDRHQYDQLAEYRDALKARGFYRMDDTP
jgi:hypothetical protein